MARDRQRSVCRARYASPRSESAAWPRSLDLADQRVEPRVQVGDALPEAGRALVGQQIHRELPAVAGVSEHAIGGDHDVVEVDLAELVDAVHRAQRAHVDARGVHVDEERRDRLVFVAPAPGAGEQDAAVRVLREAGPHLLAVDHPRRRHAARRAWSATRGRCPSPVRRSPGTTSPGPTAAAAPSRRRVRAARSRSSSGSALRASSTARGRRVGGRRPPRRRSRAGSSARRVRPRIRASPSASSPRRRAPSAPGRAAPDARRASGRRAAGSGRCSSSQATSCDRNSATVSNSVPAVRRLVIRPPAGRSRAGGRSRARRCAG